MSRRVVTTADILDGHVSLDLQCLDRIYLNGYVPNLQVGGQVVQFLALRGFPIPSPAVINRIGDGFRRAVRSFADSNQIPVIKFGKGDRKIEKMKVLSCPQSASPSAAAAQMIRGGPPERSILLSSPVSGVKNPRYLRLGDQNGDTARAEEHTSELQSR